MRILALDLGTRTGWAWWDGQRRESGVQVFDVRRGESPGMRYIRWNAWLDATLSWGPPGRLAPELVIFEQPHHRGGAATEVSAGFSTRVLEFCARHGIQHTALHSATLKKWATGRGNAKKPEMVESVVARFCQGVNFRHDGERLTTQTLTKTLDDNEADAIALLEYARARIVADSLDPTR